MAIYNLGSINIDYIYGLPHLVTAGETIAASRYVSALGGKGANQSIAIAKAGGTVFHAGMIHSDDEKWLKPLHAAGVNTDAVLRGDMPTGHAIVAVDDASEQRGENQIILAPLSNQALPSALIGALLQTAVAGDWALAQNETNLTAEYLTAAKSRGLHICYSAAPFVVDTTLALLPLVDLLIVNHIEAEALLEATGKAVHEMDIPHLIVTRGADGADYSGIDGQFHIPALNVTAVDTTGAGDTYLGYVLAQLDLKMPIQDAMRIATAAAAIQVTRHGASAAIPDMAETLN
ncbi:MAG: PfkB family carbohydrate kinase, partial [Candidatus Puniceispirillales bacterium]